MSCLSGIHIILDNLPAHKTKLVSAFLEHHPKVRFQFTPTYRLLAQSGRDLVCPHGAGRHPSWSLSLRLRSSSEI